MSQTSILIASNDRDFADSLRQTFIEQRADIRIYLDGETGADQASVAACWYPEQQLLQRYPGLKMLHSLAAGVDHLGPDLLACGLPVCRIVDSQQKQGMLEYVLWGVLHYHRHFDQALHNQKIQHWQRYPQRPAQQLTVAVMGLGEIGAHVALGLAQWGYRVVGWSRNQKSLAKVTTYCGESAFAAFLNQADILVNLLPLTPLTAGILNAQLFQKLPLGAALINAGRGEHVVDEDLIAALDQGRLRGAILDVFDEEPLAAKHPLWLHPKVSVTPHMASEASNTAIVTQLLENTRRLAQGLALLHQI